MGSQNMHGEKLTFVLEVHHQLPPPPSHLVPPSLASGFSVSIPRVLPHLPSQDPYLVCCSKYFVLFLSLKVTRIPRSQCSSP